MLLGIFQETDRGEGERGKQRGGRALGENARRTKFKPRKKKPNIFATCLAILALGMALAALRAGRVPNLEGVSLDLTGESLGDTEALLLAKALQVCDSLLARCLSAWLPSLSGVADAGLRQLARGAFCVASCGVGHPRIDSPRWPVSLSPQILNPRPWPRC